MKNISLSITSIFIVVMLLFLQGCAALDSMIGPDVQQEAMDNALLVLEVRTFEKEYAQVEKMIRVKQGTENMFTDAEWRKLLNVDATIDMVMMKANAMILLSMASISVDDVEMMYKLAKEGYKEAYGAIEAHWDEFPPSAQILLNSLDAKANMVAGQVEKMLANPTKHNISQTLTLITGILSITAKVMGVSII